MYGCTTKEISKIQNEVFNDYQASGKITDTISMLYWIQKSNPNNYVQYIHQNQNLIVLSSFGQGVYVFPMTIPTINLSTLTLHDANTHLVADSDDEWLYREAQAQAVINQLCKKYRLTEGSPEYVDLVEISLECASYNEFENRMGVYVTNYMPDNFDSYNFLSELLHGVKLIPFRRMAYWIGFQMAVDDYLEQEVTDELSGNVHTTDVQILHQEVDPANELGTSSKEDSDND